MIKSISGRSLAFATVLLILAITLAPPLHSYFAQRAQINAYGAQLAASQATLQEAEKTLRMLHPKPGFACILFSPESGNTWFYLLRQRP
jgi:uncharacterized protein (UPF0333 family)